MHSLGRLAQVNDVISLATARIKVLSIEGKRAGQLLISRMEWEDKPRE
jgi:putative hemolysin